MEYQMNSKIRCVKLGARPALMPGDVVVASFKPPVFGRALRVKDGIVTIRPTEGSNRQLMDVRRRDIKLLRTRDRLAREVGCLVTIHNGSHGGTGTLEHINGGYNYVRKGDAASGIVLELYPNEFRVEAVFRHPDFVPGTVVRFVDPGTVEWGKLKRTTHGVVRGVAEAHIVVQPMESHSGNVLFLLEDQISLESSKLSEPMDETELADLELGKLAIRALLVTCGPMTVGQLSGLLATQGQTDEAVRTNLFSLVNDGKAQLDEENVLITPLESDEMVDDSVRDALVAATAAVRKAKTVLADCVFKTIADVGGKLKR
jgi:hypothetical protein